MLWNTDLRLSEPPGELRSLKWKLEQVNCEDDDADGVWRLMKGAITRWIGHSWR